MGYRDIYKESNEQAEERFSLVMERIAEIAEETDVPEKFDDCFSYRVRKTECRFL